MVSLYIGNTDNDWFDFLAAEPDLTEINFWQPSDKLFIAFNQANCLLSGSRAHVIKSADSEFSAVRRYCHSKWRGKRSVDPTELRHMIHSANQSLSIGKILQSVLRPISGARAFVQPLFLTPDLWLDLPASWSANIVEGKGFSTDNSEGLDL